MPSDGWTERERTKQKKGGETQAYTEARKKQKTKKEEVKRRMFCWKGKSGGQAEKENACESEYDHST